MALHKLPKSYSSDFRLPNKKPVGDVEIDKGNHFAKLLAVHFPLSQNEGGFRELVQGKAATIDGAPTPVIAPHGKSTTFDGLDDGAKATGVKGLSSTEISISFWGKDNGGDGSYLSVNDGTSSNRILLYTSGNSTLIYKDHTNRLSASTSTINGVGNWGFHVVTIKSGAVNWYVNGALKASSNPAFGNLSAPIQIDVGQRFDGTFHGNKSLSDLSIFKRVLTASEVRELSNSPYQILKPQNEPVYFTSGVAGGDTLNPTFIPTQELFYQPVVTRLLQSIEPTSISTSEVFYTHTVSPQSTGITPQFIASGESVYTPDVTLLLKFIDVTHIPSEEIFYSPVVSNTLQTIAPLFTLSEEVFFRATVIGGDTIAIPIPDRATWQRVASYLSTLPYQGNNNDIIVQWLIGEGYEDSFNDGFNSYLEDNGYEGSLADKLAEWKKG